MIPALVSLKSLIKTKSYHIDHPFFRLHYKVTVCLLLGFSLILTAKILFGDTIDCKSKIVNRDDYYDNVCYSRGTFTMYAIDHDDLERAIHASTKNASLASLPPDSDSVKLAGITQTMATIQIKEERVKEKLPSITIAPPEKDNSLQRIARGFYLIVFGEDDDIKRPQPVIVQDNHDSNDTAMRNTTNYTFIPSNFPYHVLAETSLGDYLKDQWRVIHRIIKNNRMGFSSSIRYVYSGVMVPTANSRIYSITYWHRYYQYIPIILLLQAIFFYLPHYLWKNWENGIVTSICKHLHDNRMAPHEYIESNYYLIDYLRTCITLNKSLVYKYFLCHIFLMVNLFAQIIILNAVFNNQFITYGFDVLYYILIDSDIYGLRGVDGDMNDMNNPMDFVFPKVTGCTYREGSMGGGSPDRHEFLCILPLNILHDKMFLMIWFWFVVLAVLTMAQIAYDCLYLFASKYLFERRFGKHSASMSELFLLDLIGTNSDKMAFSVLLKKFKKEEEEPEQNNQSLV